MNSNINDILNKFPKEMIGEITKYLSRKEQRMLAHSCRFFKCQISTDYLVHGVLNAVAAGNQDKVVEMLTLYPHLIHIRGELTDWNKRVFYCSPFEFTRWSLDVRYMAHAMMSCVPKSAAGELIRKKVFAQFKLIGKEGLTFHQKGIKYTEKHFNFTPVKQAWAEFFLGYNDWEETERQNKWLAIGAAQAEFPAHVRQHFCNSVPFDPVPSFQEPEFQRTLTFYNWATRKKDDVWDQKCTGLGLFFSLNKGALKKCRAYKEAALIGQKDYEAIQALETVRTSVDLPALQKLLETPLYESAHVDEASIQAKNN